MPPELIVLINKPVLLIAILFVGALIGIQVERFVRWDKRRNWQRRQRRGGKVVPFERERERVPDAADQLRTVMRADFKAQPLLNKSEARLFTQTASSSPSPGMRNAPAGFARRTPVF